MAAADRDNSSSHHAPDSSADEITPIISHERGGNGGKRYDATASSSQTVQASGGGEEGGVRKASTSSSTRKRRQGQQTAQAPAEADGEIEQKPGVLSWVRDTLEKYGSVELDNKGSVARDHLALERTFLAWLRTSLAFASIGIAITQLFRLNTTIEERKGNSPADLPRYHLGQVGKPLGATFLGIAILVLLLGGRRYFESQFWIIRGKFPASRGSIFLITFIAAALIVTSLVVVCVVDPGIFERR